MGLVEGRPQSLHRHVRVLLGCGQRGMAKQLLHRSKVRSPFQHVRGRRMPQTVGSQGGQVRFLGEDANDCPCCARIQSLIS